MITNTSGRQVFTFNQMSAFLRITIAENRSAWDIQRFAYIDFWGAIVEVDLKDGKKLIPFVCPVQTLLRLCIRYELHFQRNRMQKSLPFWCWGLDFSMHKVSFADVCDFPIFPCFTIKISSRHWKEQMYRKKVTKKIAIKAKKATRTNSYKVQLWFEEQIGWKVNVIFAKSLMLWLSFVQFWCIHKRLERTYTQTQCLKPISSIKALQWT